VPSGGGQTRAASGRPPTAVVRARRGARRVALRPLFARRRLRVPRRLLHRRLLRREYSKTINQIISYMYVMFHFLLPKVYYTF
jgi:hypothetical protein